MKYYSLLLTIFFYSISYSQEHFIEGSRLLEIGDYKGADSLFTESLCTYRNENVFFNRGIARYKLADTLGFCSDMQIAANRYVDNEAASYFNKVCCKKVDTIYYDKKFRISNSTNYRYYEEILTPKYDSLIIGKIHDIKSNEPHVNIDVGCDDNKLNIIFKRTNIIAVYEKNDTLKYFIKTTERLGINNSEKWNKLKTGATAIFRTKYSFLKERNSLKELSIYFELLVSPKGEIISIQFSDTYPSINTKDVIDDINKDLKSFISHYPKITPAMVLRKKVYCESFDYIKF